MNRILLKGNFYFQYSTLLIFVCLQLNIYTVVQKSDLSLHSFRRASVSLAISLSSCNITKFLFSLKILLGPTIKENIIVVKCTNLYIPAHKNLICNSLTKSEKYKFVQSTNTIFMKPIIVALKPIKKTVN